MYENIEFIVACAGKSTRNFPHSKGIAHKCLMPFGDIRLIDCVLQDVVRMGGRHITLVVSDQVTIDAFKEALKTDLKTEEKLRKGGRERIADVLRATFLPEDIDLKYVIQETPIGTAQVLGLAHRLSPDRHAVLIFPDDLIDSTKAPVPFVKKITDSFLQNTKQILLTGIVKEDVSNNSILVNNRLIEKPKNPTSNIAGYSPYAFPKECLDSIERQTTEIEKTGKMPEGLALGEWVYTDGINAFLDNGGEEAGFFAKMEILDPEKYEMMDTGSLPLYEKALIRELLTRSFFADENREYVKKILRDME
ncbi:MAG: hypothetical protein J6V53_07220 [Alphaproteobacteria bacterium]|nr:hypothetical protein [Alphaproteobacteria bacterium]